MDEVLKAVKVLGEYCNHMHCQNCIFKQANSLVGDCMFKQVPPWVIGGKVKVEMKEVCTWEGK